MLVGKISSARGRLSHTEVRSAAVIKPVDYDGRHGAGSTDEAKSFAELPEESIEYDAGFGILSLVFNRKALAEDVAKLFSLALVTARTKDTQRCMIREHAHCFQQLRAMLVGVSLLNNVMVRSRSYLEGSPMSEIAHRCPCIFRDSRDYFPKLRT
nr:hypothetical protein [Pandoraea sputorum]